MKENAAQLNAQAINFARNGEYIEAIACFKKAISIDTDNALLWFNLGVTYRDAGQLTLAKEALKKANRLDDSDDEILETLAVINFDLGLKNEALKLCEKGLFLNINNAHIWNTLGVIFFNDEKYEKACEYFEKAVTINPYYYDALFNLRDTYQETGNQAGYLMCMRQMKSMKGHR